MWAAPQCPIKPLASELSWSGLKLPSDRRLSTCPECVCVCERVYLCLSMWKHSLVPSPLSSVMALFMKWQAGDKRGDAMPWPAAILALWFLKIGTIWHRVFIVLVRIRRNEINTAGGDGIAGDKSLTVNLFIPWKYWKSTHFSKSIWTYI